VQKKGENLLPIHSGEKKGEKKKGKNTIF